MTWAVGALLFAGFQLGLGCLFGSFIKLSMEGEQLAEKRFQYGTVRNR